MPTIDIHAPLSGTVRELLVAPGDAVAVNDEVVVMESMKMEIPVESPAVGEVAEICVERGQAVEEGATLLRLTAV
jgi:biotin carboxyl carrier protein